MCFFYASPNGLFWFNLNNKHRFIAAQEQDCVCCQLIKLKQKTTGHGEILEDVSYESSVLKAWWRVGV